MNPHDPAHAHHGLEPSAWIRRFAHLVAPGARVLDVASGPGRHAQFFAARGAQVTAVDRDAGALAALDGVAGIVTRLADIEGGAWPFGDVQFDAIVVVNYGPGQRPRFQEVLHGSLGVAGQQRAEHPEAEDADHRGVVDVARQQRGRSVPGVRVPDLERRPGVEQGMVRRHAGTAVVQRLAAVATSFPWPPALGPAAPEAGIPPRIG